VAIADDRRQHVVPVGEDSGGDSHRLAGCPFDRETASIDERTDVFDDDPSTQGVAHLVFGRHSAIVAELSLERRSPGGALEDVS
jgi:hypothetical protein